MKKIARNITLVAVVIAILAAIYYMEDRKPDVSEVSTHANITVDTSTMALEDKSKMFEAAKEITTPDAFINSDEIGIEELIGEKVILVDFWTYSCINCQRTFPYLKEWYDKYEDDGLEIIAIHTPEFEFEKKVENVQQAADEFGLDYPIVVDNDYSTWRSYRNRFWPRKYLIDIDGFIVYDHIGEGAYQETEMKIRELLHERMDKLGIEGELDEQMADVEAEKPKMTTMRISPEVYFGAGRNDLLSNGTPGETGSQSLERPQKIETNELYLVGDWQINDEYASNNEPNSQIIFKYSATDLFMVASAENELKLRVTVDGQPLGDKAGKDVVTENGESYVYVQEERLYEIVKDPEGYNTHTLEIEVLSPGLKSYTFTFG